MGEITDFERLTDGEKTELLRIYRLSARHREKSFPEVCRVCGRSLRRSQSTGCVRRQLFDIKDSRVSVTEHRALLACCRKCGASTRGQFPQGVCAPVQYGPGVLSRVGYLHLYQLLPVARTSEAMRDLFGCAGSRSKN
jgi:transposase